MVKARFGLGGALPRTLEEVGRDFRLTRERVRQIEARALHKLRQPYRNYRVRDFKLDQMLVQAGVVGPPSGTIKAARLAVAEAEAAAKRNEVALVHQRLGTAPGVAPGRGSADGTRVGAGVASGGDPVGIASELQSILGARSKDEKTARLLREGGGGDAGEVEGAGGGVSPRRHQPLLDVGLGGGSAGVGGGGGGRGGGPASDLLPKQRQPDEEKVKEEEEEDDSFEFEEEFAAELDEQFDDGFEDDFEDDLAAAVFGSSEAGGGAKRNSGAGQGGASMDAVRTLNKAWTNTASSSPRDAAEQLSIMGGSVAPRSADEEEQQLLSTLDSFDLLDEEDEEVFKSGGGEEVASESTDGAMDRLQNDRKVNGVGLGERAGAVAATRRSLQAA